MFSESRLQFLCDYLWKNVSVLVTQHASVSVLVVLLANWSAGQGRADLSGLSWFSIPQHRRELRNGHIHFHTHSHTHLKTPYFYCQLTLKRSVHAYTDTHSHTSYTPWHTWLYSLHTYTQHSNPKRNCTYTLLAQTPNGNRIICCTSYYRKVVCCA